MSYGGDELSGIVIDPGSSTVKAGNAGEDHPKLVFPSAVCDDASAPADASAGIGDANANAKAQQNETDTTQPNTADENMDVDAGTGAGSMRRSLRVDCFTTKKEHTDVRSPFQNGAIADFDAFESLLWYCIGEDSPRRLVLESNEHPVMLTEPPDNKPTLRQHTVDLLFEKFNVPAVFLAKQPVLSAFAVGRTTGLVLDMGHSGTTATPVHDGYVLQRSVQRSPIGGEVLSKLLMQDVEQGRNINIRPHMAISKKQRADGQFEVHDLDISRVSSSFMRFKKMEVLAHAKEEVCRCPKNASFTEEEYANVPTSSFELPDGTVLEYGGLGFKLPEVLFQPKLASTFAGGWQEEFPLPEKGAVQLIMDAINSCDTDVRKDLFSGVVLTGGSSLFPHMKERVEQEYVPSAPSTSKPRVIAQQSSSERRFAPFIGGSILASLGSFQQMWMSKAEYDEHGPNFIHRKAP